ncbi:P1 family peptidase [Anaerolineales bacterium HSG25]|nr:P1 family peptidase [Anaerolineales bacterium HSG25]
MTHGLTDISGLKVGHWTNLEAATGCTVVLCPAGAVAGVDVRGTAPGTREVALLDPVCMVDRVHGLLIGGGSAFGLNAADGVMRWLHEHNIGFDVGVAKVPIVPAAILFDLGIGEAEVWPDSVSGYGACQMATNAPVAQGNVGAGTGATAGKLLGFQQATKTGLGSANRHFADGLIVSAMVAPNPMGDIYDPTTQQIIAGARQPNGGFADSLTLMADMHRQQTESPTESPTPISNTTLAIIATNARFNKTQATKIAQMAHDGLARTIRPIHTHFDGDTIFALSHGDKQADVSFVGAIAAEVLAEAVIAGTKAAESLHGLPAAQDLISQ